MDFLTGSEKIVQLRKKLNLRQKDFETKNFTRGYLGLLENGKRNITEEAARTITEIFKDKASELGIELDIDDKYFLRSVKEEAEKYCIDQLLNDLTEDQMSSIKKICDKYELYSVKSKVYLKLGDYYYDKNEYMYAFKNYFYSLDLLKNTISCSEKCYVYNRLGMCKYMLLNYEEAIIYFNKAKTDAFIINEDKVFKNSTYNLALSYQSISNLQDAVKNIDIVIEMCNKEENVEEYVYANTFKANCYEQIGEIDKSVSIYENIITIVDDDNLKLLGYLYNNMGGLLFKKGSLTKSLEYYNKSQQIRSKVDKEKLSHTLIEKALVYKAKELYEEALIIIELGIEEATKNNDYEYVLKGYEELENIYEKLDQYDDCKEILKKLIRLLQEQGNILNQVKYYNILLGGYLKERKYDKVKECQNEIINLIK